ncbi:MAG TPA: hypothetical protein VFB50_15985 [Chloroflexota bacterium]|nr:hypothetical protein [Chloroflexota bacterium]
MCSITWVLQATHSAYVGEDIYAAREKVQAVLGVPECVNPTYGCMSGQCVIDCFAKYGLQTKLDWLTFDQAYALARVATGCLSGTAWNHYVGIRGVSGEALYVANSAPGWMGVRDVLTRRDFERLGPFKCIYLEVAQ